MSSVMSDYISWGEVHTLSDFIFDDEMIICRFRNTLFL